MRVFQPDQESSTARVLPIGVHSAMRISNEEEALMVFLAGLQHLGAPSVSFFGYETKDFISTQMEWLSDPAALFALLNETSTDGMDIIGTPEVLILAESAYEYVDGAPVMLHCYVLTRTQITEVRVTGRNKEELDIKVSNVDNEEDGSKKSALREVARVLFHSAPH